MKSFNTNIKLNFYKNFLFILVIVLSFFGCIMIYSATVCRAYPNYTFLKKQIIAIVIGTILCGFTSYLKPKILKKITLPLFIFTIFLLIAVFFFPKVKEVHRWIPLPFLGNFQPAELAKVVSILLIAKFLDSYRSKIINGEKKFWILFLMIFTLCVLIAIQPDLGFPLIIFCTFFIILFVYSVKLKHLLKAFMLILIFFTLAFFSKPYRVKRILSLNNSQKYQKETAYQLNQSILSLSRGGFYGCGITKGIFKEFYIPELHTDFIFSLIGEELGFLGSSLVILAYVFFAFLGFSLFYKLSHSENGFYGSILALGITLSIILQAYLSISVVTKLFFPKGIGLPFISYGGSSIVINFLSIGILMSISNNKS
ncbi:MAG: FtsW/RodA/SpoVE family cell cycle protein [Elusimicrobiota bacterium]|nr:FtsW/RodA/SpoVE family cell cycle protein [Endomicrobiia bacterium]MDW8165881.1 FtsW/RodA/SpoVE family cell cycle protein [Elusimicrobiota bacterium]